MAQSKSTSTGPLKPNKKKAVQSLNGAPSQHNQSSRKGKRAWRKNVDIDDVEEAIEGMRAEERVTGTTLQKMSDSDLFQIDIQGDFQIRKHLPRFSSSLLTSTKILSERSAVPAVFSRPTHTQTKRKASSLSYEEKSRLLRIAKRPRKGPFNSIIDPTQPGEGSALLNLTEAIKTSGTYDPWPPQPEVEEEKDGLETVRRKPVKPPPPAPIRGLISVPAVTQPHQGTSYNPPVDAHQELLLQAHEIEERRLRDTEKLAEVKERMENARLSTRDGGGDGVVLGMTVDGGVDVDQVEEEEEQTVPVKKPPPRKTQAQRNRAACLLAEKRDRARQIANKRLLSSIPSTKHIRLTNTRHQLARAKLLAEKRLAAREKLKKQGLAGQKLGKYKVPVGNMDVQLGEDLSESLRALKPEGNLFRERFLSLQQRALIEPRIPLLPKKRRTKTVEYEKHAWKRFQ